MAVAVSENTNFEHITPSKSELQPFHKIYCEESDCKATFTNAGNYDLHLQRHHKIIKTTSKRGKEASSGTSRRLYYCPIPECIYNFNSKSSGRHFKHMKNIRQHFQKVHFKSFICENCGRAFPTAGQFKTHTDNVCGKQQNCFTCDWGFETKEALIIHGKRKGHNIYEANDEAVRQKISKTALTDSIVLKTKATVKQKLKQQDSQTQTDIPSIMDTETQTSRNDYHNMQTQTEPTLLEQQQQQQQQQQRYHQRSTSPMCSSNSVSDGGFLDQMHMQMLAHTSLHTHMHTQTCNDYLLSISELGLADIQTQTNWSAFNESSVESSLEHNKLNNNTSTTTGFAHDELLVSTETQTSFTQCLLESTAKSGPNGCGTGTGDESNGTIHYGHLYNTQYTQTCDLLLGGLFGGQENDLITGFQSTYTQT